MTSVLVDDNPRDVPADARTDPVGGAGPDDRGLRRFVAAVVIGFGAVTVPYLVVLWDLWTGRFDVFRQFNPDNFYDLQGRAMLAGHLWVPDRLARDRGVRPRGPGLYLLRLFPSLLRLPVLAFTNAFDGRLTAPSMLLAWFVTGLLASLLLWRVRVLVRGDAAVGMARGRGLGYGRGRPHRRVGPGVPGRRAQGVRRGPGLERGPHRGHAVRPARRPRAPIVGPGRRVRGPGARRGARPGADRVRLLPWAPCWLPVGSPCRNAAGPAGGGFSRRRWSPSSRLTLLGLFVNWAKLGTPFGLSEADQVWTHINRPSPAVPGGQRRAAGSSLRFLPSTLTAYLQPAGVHLQSAFPWITLPTARRPTRSGRHPGRHLPTDSFPASMPLSPCSGLGHDHCLPTPPGRPGGADPGACWWPWPRPTSGVLLFGYVADRYLADFLPFLVALAGSSASSTCGAAWRGGARCRGSRAGRGVVLLGGFGVWANVAPRSRRPPCGRTPRRRPSSRLSSPWVGRRRVSHGAHRATGSRTSPRPGRYSPSDCSGLYVSTGFSYADSAPQQLMHKTWDPSNRAPGSTTSLQVVFRRRWPPGDPAVTLLTWGRDHVSCWCPRGWTASGPWSRTPAGRRGSGRPLDRAPTSSTPGVGLPIVGDHRPVPDSPSWPGVWGVGSSTTWPGPGPAVRPHRRPAGPGRRVARASVTDATGPPPLDGPFCRRTWSGAAGASDARPGGTGAQYRRRTASAASSASVWRAVASQLNRSRRRRGRPARARARSSASDRTGPALRPCRRCRRRGAGLALADGVHVPADPRGHRRGPAGTGLGDRHAPAFAQRARRHQPDERYSSISSSSSTNPGRLIQSPAPARRICSSSAGRS